MSHEDINDILISMQHRSEHTRHASVLHLLEWLERASLSGDDSLKTRIVSCICSRLQLNDRETSEELRAHLIRTVGASLRIPDIAPMEVERLYSCLICGLTDECPAVKRAACAVISGLNIRTCSNSIERMSEALVRCMRHHQWRVRSDASAATINFSFQIDPSGSRVIVNKIDDIFLPLLSAVGDDTLHVREVTIQSLAEKLLNVTDEERMQPWLHKFVYVLIAGLLDKSEPVRQIITSLIRDPCDSIKAFHHPSDAVVRRFTLRHSQFCIEKSTAVLSNPGSDTVNQLHALKVLYIMLPNLSESSLPAVTSTLANQLASGNPETLVNDCVDIIASMYGLNIICDCIISILRGSATQPSRGYLCLLHGVMKEAVAGGSEAKLSESLVSLFEIGSLWPGLHREIRLCCSLLRGAFTIEPSLRDRVFDIMVTCLSADDENGIKAIQDLLGADVFDDSLRRSITELLGDSTRTTAWDSLSCILKHVRGESIASCMDLLDKLITESTDPSESIESIAHGLEVIHILCTTRTVLTDGVKSSILSAIAALLKWKPGETRNIIRKLALVCFNELITVVDNEIDISTIQHVLIECMEDCWSPDNRLLAMWAIGMLAKTGSVRPDSVYMHVLNRLDDSQLVIRKAACDLLLVMANIDQLLSARILEKLLIHKHDPSESMRTKVNQTIETLTSNIISN